MMTGDGKSLVCGMGTNFSPGILLTCFFVVGQQSCLSIVLQKSRLNKAIFSCAFQHKKSMLFSTEKAHTHRSQTNYCHGERLQSSAQTCPHEVQEERRHLKRLWSKISWGITLITNDSISVEPMARLLRNRKWPRTWISDEWSCCSSQIKIGETTSVCDELDWGSSQNHTVFKTLEQFFNDSFHTCAWGTGWFVMNLSQVHHKSRFLWIGHFVMNNHVVLICDEPQSSSSQITGWD